MKSIEHVKRSISAWLMNQPAGDHFESLSDLGISLATSQGNSRNANEDRVAYIEVCRLAAPRSPLGVALVADGIGGSARGEEAAVTAVAAIASYVALGETGAGLKSLLLGAMRYANEGVFSLLGGNGGTTVSAILYGRQGAIGANVGDSRIYEIRGGRAISLTIDDTLEAYIRPLRKNRNPASITSKDERLAQYIGIGRDLEPHLVDLDTGPSESRYVLTTDGAYFLGEANLYAIYQHIGSRRNVARSIVEVSRSLGSTDDATAIECPKMPRLISDETPPSITIHAPGRTLTVLLGFQTEAQTSLPMKEPAALQPMLFDVDAPSPSLPRPGQRKSKTKRTRRSPPSKKKTPRKSRRIQASNLELVPADARMVRKK